MFWGHSQLRRYFDMLRLDLRLVHALTESGCISFVFHPQQLVTMLRLAFRIFSTEVYTSILRGCSGRNWSNFERRKIDNNKNNPQMNVCISLADSYSSSKATTARKIAARFWWGG